MGLEKAFAYERFRPGQRELASRVHDTSASGGILVAEAMSGFGKTAAVLAGAISAAEETESKVIYACRTKRQVLRVVEELSALQRKHDVSVAPMFSKFDYCLLRLQSGRLVSPEAFGWYCQFKVSNNLCSYFLNVALAGHEFDAAVKGATRAVPTHPELLRLSQAIHVCPYEIAKMVLTQARVIIVPYPYVFESRAASLLFNSVEAENAILVVDEAHNLRDFLRGVNSATLSLGQVDGAIKEAKAMLMDEAAASLGSFRETLGTSLSSPGWLLDRDAILQRFRDGNGTGWLQNLAFELSACAGPAWGVVEYGKKLPSLILKVGDFISRLSSESDLALVKWDDYFGVLRPNPVAGLSELLGQFRSSVLVSATVNPSDVFRRSLGLDSNAATYTTPAESLVTVRTIVDTGVTTRYKLRTPQMFCKIADRIAAVAAATPGGMGVFASSYSILEAIREQLQKRIGDRNLVKEERGLSSQESSDAFDSFRSTRGSVLLAVQGGRFSEGEDFRGDMMDTVVVVGLSLPPPSPMLYAEYLCLKRTGEPDSFMMLSRLPALRKAFQAAGRHIRTEGKRGVVVMLDERFSSRVVRDLMPSWLKREVIIGEQYPERLRGLISQFWNAREQPFPS